MSDIDRIENRIRIMGIKKSHIAKQVEVTPEYLSMVLNHKRQMSKELKTRLFTYLGLS